MKLKDEVKKAIKERGIVKIKLDGLEFYITDLENYVTKLDSDYRVVRAEELEKVPGRELKRFLDLKFRFNRIFGFNTVIYGKKEQG